MGFIVLKRVLPRIVFVDWEFSIYGKAPKSGK